MYQIVLTLHVIAATVWTGGHIVLALGILPGALIDQDVERIVRFESVYERIGMPALFIQIMSGLWLAHNIIPQTSGWFSLDNPFSQLLVFKFSLLAMTALLAVDARFRLIPNLTVDNLTDLAWHIVPVTVLSILFVIVGIGFRFGGF
jgi:putative copper export protein